MALNKPEMMQNNQVKTQLRGDIKKKKDIAEQIEQIAELEELGAELNPITADNMLAQAPASVMSDANVAASKAGLSSVPASAGPSAMTIGFGIAGAAVVVAAASNSSSSSGESPTEAPTTPPIDIPPPELPEVNLNDQTLNVQDGPIAESRVYLDANANGMIDTSTDVFLGTTDENGFLTVTGELAAILAANPGATIMATGGYDIELNAQRIADGLDPVMFDGILKAPVGASVVNPLTTVMTALIDAGLTTEEANDKVLEAFGLDADLDLTSFNPIAVMASGDATPEDKAIALATKKAAVQLANLFTSVQTLGEGNVMFYEAAIANMAELLGESDGVVSLSSNKTILALLPDGDADIRAQYAQALAQANRAIEMALDDAEIINVQQVVQTVTDANDLVETVLTAVNGDGVGFINITEGNVSERLVNSPLLDTTALKFSDSQREQELIELSSQAMLAENALVLAQAALNASRAMTSDSEIEEALTAVQALISNREDLEASIASKEAMLAQNAEAIEAVATLTGELESAREANSDEALAEALETAENALVADVAANGTDEAIQQAVDMANVNLTDRAALQDAVDEATASLNDDVTLNGTTQSLQDALTQAQTDLVTHVTVHGTTLELDADLTAAQTALTDDVTAKGDQEALETALVDAESKLADRMILETALNDATTALQDHETAFGTDVDLQDAVDGAQALVNARALLEDALATATANLEAARLIASDVSLEDAATAANGALDADIGLHGTTDSLATAVTDAQTALDADPENATLQQDLADAQALLDSRTDLETALSTTQANVTARVLLMTIETNAQNALDEDILANGTTEVLESDLADAQALLAERNGLKDDVDEAQTALLADIATNGSTDSLTTAATLAQADIDARYALELAIADIEVLIGERAVLEDAVTNASALVDNRTELLEAVTLAQDALDADELANGDLVALSDALNEALEAMDNRIELAAAVDRAQEALNARNALISDLAAAQEAVGGAEMIEQLTTELAAEQAALAADILANGDMNALESLLTMAQNDYEARMGLIEEVAQLQAAFDAIDIDAINQELYGIRTSSDYQFMDTIVGFEFGTDMIALLGSSDDLLGQPNSLSVLEATSDGTDFYSSLALALEGVEHSSAAFVDIDFTNPLLASYSGTYLFVNDGDAEISQSDDIWVKLVSTTGDINSVTLENTFVSNTSNEV